MNEQSAISTILSKNGITTVFQPIFHVGGRSRRSTRMKPSLAGRGAQASSNGKTTFNLRFEIQEKGDPMSRKKILIVDDSATILMMERMILSKGPYELVTAGDGEEAVRKAVSERPDLIR